MDLEEFTRIYNANDDFAPDFDLGMDQIMASLDETQDRGTQDHEVPDVSSQQTINEPTDDPPAPRITPLTADDIHDFVVNQKAKSTSYKDTGGTKRLQTFLQDVNQGRNACFMSY